MCVNNNVPIQGDNVEDIGNLGMMENQAILTDGAIVIDFKLLGDNRGTKKL